MKRPSNLWLILLVLALAACSAPPAPSSPAQQPTVPPLENTAAPVAAPTDTPAPTQTIAPTPLPEGTIFRDDFTGSLQPRWTWENENSGRWILTSDGFLQIIAQDPSLLAGQEQENTLWRDLPDGNFAISVHLITKPTMNFQQAAIFLFEDVNNYVAINRGYCAPCFPGQDGNGIFMDYKINGQGNAYKLHVDQTDVYLQLEFKDDVITANYAFTADQWERLGRFGNYFKFKRVGLGAANIDQVGANEDLVAQYDYFEITKP